MKGAVDDDHLALRLGLARELDRGLGRLRTGVAQIRLAAQAALRQAVGETHRGLGIEEVGHVHQPAHLLAHRRDDAWVAVAEVGHRDAAQEVEVLVAIVVPQPHPLPAHELHGLARVRRDHAARLDLPQLGERHMA